MTRLALSFIAMLSLALTHSSLAQQTATPSNVLSPVLSALGGTNIQGVSFTGSVTTVAGATGDSGTFTASCTTGGSSQLSLQLSGSSRSETRQVVNGIQSGSWVDTQGVQHSMAPHNLWTDASWFCPVVAVADYTSGNALNIQSVGNVAKNGATLAHYTIVSIFPGTAAQNSLLTHLSQMDAYFDPATSELMDLDFTVHPDNNAAIDLQVEIQFSNYTQVNGVLIPFTIMRLVNSTPVLLLQVQTATPTLTTGTAQ